MPSLRHASRSWEGLHPQARAGARGRLRGIAFAEAMSREVITQHSDGDRPDELFTDASFAKCGTETPRQIL